MMTFNTNVQCEEMFSVETMWFSDCCSEHMDSLQIDHEVCPRCGEHCEVIREDFPVITH